MRDLFEDLGVLVRKIWIASDHAGFELKARLVEILQQHRDDFQTELIDLGPTSAARVDYPDFAKLVCREVLQHSDSRGILICGSGQGMAIAANRHRHIRAALCWSETAAELARAHNDANVLCLGARLIEADLAVKILKVFLSTAFEGERHVGRIQKLDQD